MADHDNKRLGKGLGAIFGENIDGLIEEIQSADENGYGYKSDILVNKIILNPYQPRKIFSEEKIDELAQSIAVHGVFTPILVKETVNGFQLITGERRLRATKKLGLQKIPAIIVNFSEEVILEISLLENIQREDLNIIEEAKAYQQLIEKFEYTQEDLASRLGKSREHVSNTLRLLKLPAPVTDLVELGKLSMGHVRPLITLDSSQDAIAYANKIMKEKLSVREVEKLVKKPLVKTKLPERTVDNNVVEMVKKLEDKYQSKVLISKDAITFKYTSASDLNRLLELLGVIEELD